MRKIALLFGLFVLCVQAFAIDPFTLKGKTIIIPPYVCKTLDTNTGKEVYSYKGFDNVYNDKVLKRNRFDNRNKVQIDIYGKEIYVEDVFFIDKQDQNRAVCLVVLKENERFVLRFPLFELPRLRDGYVYFYDYDPSTFLGDLEDGNSEFIVPYYFGLEKRVNSKLYNPHSLQLIVYEVDKIREVDAKYNGRNVFIISESPSKKVSQLLWKYERVFFPWENTEFDYFSLAPENKRFQFGIYDWKDNQSYYNYKHPQSLVLTVFKHGDSQCYLDLDSETPPVFEDEYYDQCRLRYKTTYVDEMKGKYVGQKVHITLNPNTYLSCYSIDSLRRINSGIIKSGCYFFDRVELGYTNSKDSLYYSYHGVMMKIEEGGEYGKELFCPINCFRQANIELDSIYHERLHQQELDQIKAREDRLLQEQKEEQEYYQVLVRKYGKTNAKLIKEGEVRIGFTKEMCIEAWGEPEYINTTTTADGKTEQWVYGWFSYLYFKGNKLIAIQDQE